MMAGSRDQAQYASDGVALTLTVGLAATLMTATPAHWLSASVPSVTTNEPSIELSLDAPPAPPIPAPPAPPRIVTPRPQPRPTVAASITAPAPPEPMPVEPSQVPAGAALIATAGTMPAPPASSSVSHADLEAQYAAGLRADIDRRTHPPDSMQYRLRHPTGEVRVRFSVTRNGEPRNVTLLHSSGFSILDEAAVTVVSSGIYAPMPANVFAGEPQHVFAVTIEFLASIQAARIP